MKQLTERTLIEFDCYSRTVRLLDKAERAYFCDEHYQFGGPKRCEIGAQIAPNVCRMIPGWFLPNDEEGD